MFSGEGWSFNRREDGMETCAIFSTTNEWRASQRNATRGRRRNLGPLPTESLDDIFQNYGRTWNIASHQCSSSLHVRSTTTSSTLWNRFSIVIMRPLHQWRTLLSYRFTVSKIVASDSIEMPERFDRRLSHGIHYFSILFINLYFFPLMLNATIIQKL